MLKQIKAIYIKYAEIINYLIVGVLTTIVSLATYYIFAYFTNRKYVFKSKEKNKLKEASKFVVSRLLTLGMDMFVMFLGVTVLHLNDKIIKLISQVVVTVGNYVLSKLFVFKKTDKK